ncbi:MAG: tetratricopeptide repeat protein [Acidobacteriia bacterium]|nr:tetratricopeptide repeat protein [Terriglobia bacterium]
MQTYRAAAALAPAKGDPIEAALSLRGKGRLEEALAALSGAEEFSQDVCVLRGDLQRELGRIQDAVSSYSTVIAFESGNVYARYNLALCLRRLKRWEAAAEAFRKLLAYDSHRDSARIGLGDCLLHLNRLEEALACFDACWSEGAQTRALFGKAVALQMLGRLEEAESAYERLLTLDPKMEEAFSNLIALSMKRLDLVRVHRYALRLLELCPESPVALQGLVAAAVERFEYESAAGYWARLARQRTNDRSRPEEDLKEGIDYHLSADMADRLHRMGRDGSGPERRAWDRATGGQ